MVEPTCPRCGFQGAPARRYEAQGLIKCGGCQQLVNPADGPRPPREAPKDGSATGDSVEADLSEGISGQAMQVLALRLMGGLPAVFLLIPTQAPPDEVILTTSWLFWGFLSGLVWLAFAQLFAGTEARALEYARRPGGARLRIDEKRLKLPHIATIGPARNRAIRAGQPFLTLPWSEVHEVVATNGRNGRPAIRFLLEAPEDASAIWAPDHVFLLCAGPAEGKRDRILAMARRYAGRRGSGDEGSGDAVVRRGLSVGQLEANRKASLGVGGIMALGMIAAGLTGNLDPSKVASGLAVVAVVSATTWWKIEMAIERQRR